MATTVEDVERWAGAALPPTYRALLPTLREELVGGRVLLYPLDLVIERNETYETREYCPGCLAIGDDSGGCALVIALDDPACAVFRVDHGAMDRASFEPLGAGLATWVAAGCPLPIPVIASRR